MRQRIGFLRQPVHGDVRVGRTANADHNVRKFGEGAQFHVQQSHHPALLDGEQRIDGQLRGCGGGLLQLPMELFFIVQTADA